MNPHDTTHAHGQHPMPSWQDHAEHLFEIGEMIEGDGILLKIVSLAPDDHAFDALILGVNRKSAASKLFFSGQVLTFERSLHTNRWLLQNSSEAQCAISIQDNEKLLQYFV